MRQAQPVERSETVLEGSCLPLVVGRLGELEEGEGLLTEQGRD